MRNHEVELAPQPAQQGFPQASQEAARKPELLVVHNSVRQQERVRLSYSARNHARELDMLLERVEPLADNPVAFAARQGARKQVQVDQQASQVVERTLALSATQRIAVEALELLLGHRSVSHLRREEALAAALRTLGLDLLQH